MCVSVCVSLSLCRVTESLDGEVFASGYTHDMEGHLQEEVHEEGGDGGREGEEEEECEGEKDEEEEEEEESDGGKEGSEGMEEEGVKEEGVRVREEGSCGLEAGWKNIHDGEKSDVTEDEDKKDGSRCPDNCSSAADIPPQYVGHSADRTSCVGSSGQESVSSSNCTASTTTTSYLHGDRATVQLLVARGLRKKHRQNHRRVRPKKQGKVGDGGTRANVKRELKWSLDSGW